MLRKEIKEAHDQLFHKALKGILSNPPQDRIFLQTIKDILPDALCNIYSEHHRSIELVNDVKELTERLRDSAIDVMNSSEMFSKRTKSRVVEKINRMVVNIGKGGSPPLPNIRYTSDSFLHTVLKINEERTKMLTDLTGKPVNAKTSSFPCFITNASYFQETNHIVIPWGIIQPPFFSINVPLGCNHGAIGVIIGHEITHAFDLTGSQYSPRATKREWWTRRDRSAFKRKTRKLSKFYSKFKHYGKHIDGEKTLSENWADLGGVTISLHSLNTQLDSMNASHEEKKEAHRNFFLSYARSWRILIRKKMMLFSILTNVHAPSEDRVDRIVPQFQEWYDAFNIKESDKLFLKQSERLKFF